MPEDGSAFSTVTNVPCDRFRWIKGESLLRGFESSPGKTRYFCSHCGSLIVAAREGKGTVLLRMGCLGHTDHRTAQNAHLAIGWRLWFDPKDQLPELQEGTPPKA